MPKISPISWREFVKKLRGFDFDGPFQQGRHPYMIKENLSITIPNPHEGDISPDLLLRILKQACISRKDWIKK